MIDTGVDIWESIWDDVDKCEDGEELVADELRSKFKLTKGEALDVARQSWRYNIEVLH